MVKSLSTIKGPIEEELKIFEQRFREAMRSKVPLLDKIMYYIVQRKGKEVRPMFVFLSAKVCGETNDSTYDAASLIELLQTFAFVHDDVVDDNYRKKSFFSIDYLWKKKLKIAVLVGDYLMNKSLSLAVKNKEFGLLEIVSVAAKEMSEGEILHIDKARIFDIDEETYFKIIKKKTASLVAAACSAGASSVNRAEEDVEKMRIFGEKIGIAFHIRDDLYDLGVDGVNRKSINGVKEIKMTLPLIHVLQKKEPTERKRLINIIKQYPNNKDKIKELMLEIENGGGVEYARASMMKYREEGFAILNNFADSTEKEALKDLVVFVTDRKR